MEISELTFRLVLLFIPGFLGFLALEALTVHPKYGLVRLLLYSFLIGIAGYTAVSFIGELAGTEIADILDYVADDQKPIRLSDLFFASVGSLLVALVATWISNNKIIVKVARWLSLTSVHGDISLLAFVMNSKVSNWIVVRDIENNLMYYGWLQAYSDPGERDELLLLDVQVFKNETAEKLYSTPSLYLPRSIEKLTFEFVQLNGRGNDEAT